MFGFVTANRADLSPEERERYRSLYCGVCRAMGRECSQGCRLCLTYDGVFLALVLSSLYEPEEKTGKGRCLPHPFKPQAWVASPAVSYAAAMNTALAYYSARDNWEDERSLRGRAAMGILGPHLETLRQEYPRQLAAMKKHLGELARLEKENCPNPDLPANAFAGLLGEVFLWQEDRWADTLRGLGYSLGRFIYLADAAMDYDRDRRKGAYNPFLAMGQEKEPSRWEEYLTAELASCAACLERLPLVQDKKIIDNIIYSGVWLTYRQAAQKGKGKHDR